MNDINQVLSFVLLEASTEQLSSIAEAMKSRRETLARLSKRTLAIGQPVMFTSKGVTYKGQLKAIKTKFGTVETEVPDAYAYTAKMKRVPATVSYRVPLSMLVAA